jgi:hypothetical protein
VALRAERDRRLGHHMLAHLRSEAYAAYSRPVYPRAGHRLTLESNNAAIEAAKRRLCR